MSVRTMMRGFATYGSTRAASGSTAGGACAVRCHGPAYAVWSTTSAMRRRRRFVTASSYPLLLGQPDFPERPVEDDVVGDLQRAADVERRRHGHLLHEDTRQRRAHRPAEVSGDTGDA